MRCPMCHNGELVTHPGNYSVIEMADILNYLNQRTGKITGIVISGGEPTLSPSLKPFLYQLRELEVKIKLDSNGLQPQILADLLQENLLDYVAMDIKAPLEKYDILSGVSIDLSAIQHSIDLIRSCGLPYEFRTTVIPSFLAMEDILNIGEWLQGIKRFALQQFQPGHCLKAELDVFSPYPAKVLYEMKTAVQPYFDEVILRGV